MCPNLVNTVCIYRKKKSNAATKLLGEIVSGYGIIDYFNFPLYASLNFQNFHSELIFL